MQYAECRKARPPWRNPFLHSAFCILHFVLFLGCATDSIGGDVEMRTLATGSYAAAQPEQPRAVLIASAGDYARIWDDTIGSGERPQADFATESVVILLAGAKPTGGHSVEPRGVKLDGRVLVVDAVMKSPPSDAIVTQAFTSPFAVIAVKTKALDSVRWTP